MLKWLLRRPLDGFERRYDYDMSYAREILAASPTALLKFARLQGFAAHRQDVPIAAWYAAKLAATVAEDCGPCTQLVVRMAEKEGVEAPVLQAILARDLAAMPPDAALGLRYADAVIAHDLAANAMRVEILERWGPRALTSLAFAVTSARLFPTLKYALGHGHACVRVKIGNTDVSVARQAA